MNSETLTTSQAATIREALQASLSYLYRLRLRMEKAGFPPNDPLFLRVCAAYDAMHVLCQQLPDGQLRFAQLR